MVSQRTLQGLSILNPSPVELPGPKLLHELVHQPRQDDAPALDFLSGRGERSSMSYQQLHDLSNVLAGQISQQLQSLPVERQPQQLIVPCMIPQSPQLYVAVLAILKAGGAFCPLNLDAPPDRIKFILEDVGAVLALASPEFQTRIPRDGDDAIHLICVDELEATTAKGSGDLTIPWRQPDPSSLAYVMYTSGSTGLPKGVGIPHGAATQSLLAHDRHIPPFKRFLQFAATTFDVSVFEIFFPLIRAATLVCCDRAEMLTDLPGVIRRMNVDACELTPSVASSLLRTRQSAPCLRLLLTIGEMLTDNVIQEFGGREGQESMLWGMYGPTEATIHCTLQPAFAQSSVKNNVGFPLDTVSAFIIEIPPDSKGVPPFKVLPVGEVGELVVGGHQLASGYLRRPEQTSAAFLETAWGRVYRTGDKAMMRHDGIIECLGRISDGQVKLNGQRIELGEIEQVMLKAEGCRGAVAAVISNTLVAFAEVDDISDAQSRIRTTCKAWLPPYMIPKEIIPMGEFPRLPSAKVDRRKLRADYTVSSTSQEQAGGQFTDELGKKISEVISHVLGTQIGRDTPLNSAGMDSLAAIRFASELRESGFIISALSIMEANTLESIVQILQSSSEDAVQVDKAEGVAACAVVLSKDELRQNGLEEAQVDDIEHTGRCTPLQLSMLTETMRDPRMYINHFDLAFPANVDLADIKSFFLQITEQNDILRSGFAHTEKETVFVTWKRLLESQIQEVENLQDLHVTDFESFINRPFLVGVQTTPTGSERHARVILHHGLYDGWTSDLMINDLNTLIQGEALQERPSFRTISEHLQQPLAGDELTRAREFWAGHLRGSDTPPFPNLRTHAITTPKIMSKVHEVQLSPSAVKELSGKYGFSPQTIFQGCISWLFAQICGSDEVVIGSVLSGRHVPIRGIEKVMGPCLMTLPMKINHSHYHTVQDMVQGLTTKNREIMRHGRLPLHEIKSTAGLNSASKLFDLLFVYQESLPSRSRNLNSLVQEVSHQDALESKLLFEIEPTSDHFNCRITWHSESIPDDEVDTIANQLESLVLYCAEHLGEPLATVHQCFQPQVLSRYNVVPEYPDTPQSLQTAVESSAALYPDSTAICFARSITQDGAEVETLTYNELNSQANQVARYLQKFGVQPGGVIAIIMEKSPVLYVTILGILKAGCGYLPILPSAPSDRVQTILDQSRPQLCIIEEGSGSRSPHSASCQVITINSRDLVSLSYSNLGLAEDTSRTAYVVYTSGTTGVPKGVSVTTRNILSNIAVLTQILPHDRESRMLQACSQAFDVSVFEIFFTLANGMCLCAATNDTLFYDLERSIRLLGVTHLDMTVTVASLVNPKNVPGVKVLATMGEPMTDKVLNDWADLLYQGYGPSETTNIVTCRKMRRGDFAQCLGHTFRNTSAFVMHPGSDEVVPFGCLGELCFGGDQIADGYLNLPDVTASRFIEHSEYGRLYRSGDLGRMLPDGSLLIQGRLDTQVKIRGQRVELGEISSVVLGTGLVEACTSALVDHQETKSQQLALFYVPREAATKGLQLLPLTDSLRCIGASLRDTMSAMLPSYMMPSLIIPISTLPLTSSGKIDTKSLHSAISDLSQQDLEERSSQVERPDEDSSQWSDLEIKVANVLAQSLNMDPSLIGRWTPFAALGLDSISAMPVARKLQSITGAKVPLSLVLKHPSIGRLAQAITAIPDSADQEVQAREFLSKDFIERTKANFRSHAVLLDAVYPCTPLQQAMLVASVSSSSTLDSPQAYTNQMLFRLRRDPAEMTPLWEAVIQRHQILRTCFVTTDDSQWPIAQAVLQEFTPSWARSQIMASGLSAAVASHIRSLSSPLDSSTPAISFAMFETGPSETYLSFVCHHALYDGVSIRNILSEIESLAKGIELPPAPSFQTLLPQLLSLPAKTDEFWKNQFHGFQQVQITPDNAKLNDDHFLSVVSRVDRSLSGVNARLREIGASLLSACQTAWATSLTVLLGRSDVCFGNVVSGRSASIDDIDSMVGPIFNTVPMRVATAKHANNSDLMKHLAELNIQVAPYQFTPLHKVQSAIHSVERLVEFLLILQPPAQRLESDIWELLEDNGSMDVPVVCEVTPCPQDDTLQVDIHINSSLPLSAKTIIREIFIRSFNHSLQYPLSRPLQQSDLSSDIQLLTPSFRITDRTPKSAAPEQNAADDGPWNENEQYIRETIAELSGVSGNSMKKATSIYHLGFNSISAVQIASALRKDGYLISVLEILEFPSLEGIAARLESSRNPEASETPRGFAFNTFQQAIQSDLQNSNIEESRIAKVLPCTSSQAGMLSDFILSGGVNYYNYVSWDLEPEVSLQDLLGAWGRTAVALEILRAGFIEVKHPEFSFATVVYKDHQPASQTEIHSISKLGEFQLEKWRKRVAQRAFHDLSQPPWKVCFVEGTNSKQMHLAMHHALYDAHSLEIILQNVAIALAGGEPTAMSLDPIVSHILESQTSVSSEAEEFWKQRAADFAVNPFPTLTPLRMEISSIRSAKRQVSVLPSLLKSSAAELGITLQAAFQAAWTRILSAYQGESTVAFGVVMSGRTAAEVSDGVFPLITTLPVVASNVRSNKDLIQSMMDLNASLRRFQYTPLPQVRKWLGGPEGRLFDSLLVYQQTPANAGIHQPWSFLEDAANIDCPISLEIEDGNDNSLVLNLVYQDNVLPSEQATTLLDQFDATLVHLLTRPNGGLEDLYETAPELFSVMPPEFPELPSPVSLLHEFVEDYARENPEKIALEFIDSMEQVSNPRRWTYQDLSEAGNRVANLLQSNSVIPGGIVAVCFDKCPEAYFSILGILKAGCAFVALDPGAPASRHEFILRDSGAQLLLTKDLPLQLSSVVTVLEISESKLAAFSSQIPENISVIQPSDTCYCLYTSGTTGTPKGCLISHENTVQAMLAFQRLFADHWNSESRWLQFASFHFDVSVLEQYWSWSVGIAVVAAPRDLILSDLITTISSLKITHIDLTPSLARLVQPEDVPSLCDGVFITGGEKLRQEILDSWGPKGVIYNAYGPTEATIGVTMYQRVPINGRPSNIGKQFSNVGSFVLEPGTDLPVLKGAVGELCVSGKLVGVGYLNRPELTEQRFPTLSGFEERVYRTGDLVRLLPDGCFDFLGRADDQVKLRGQRLEIGEIDHTMKSQVSEIVDLATIVMTHGAAKREMLVSFIAIESSKPSSGSPRIIFGDKVAAAVSRARDACRAKLPSYMVPTHILGISSIPLSANNKADHRRLRELFNGLSQEELRQIPEVANDSAALGPEGERICQTLAEHLGLAPEAIQATSTIFEIGLDSISVIGAARALRAKGFDNAGPAMLLRYPRVGDFVRHLQSRANSVSSDGTLLQFKQSLRAYQQKHITLACNLMESMPDEIEYIAPCTPLQEGMIVRSVTSAGDAVYYNTFQFDLRPHVDVARLQDSWAAVIRGNSIYRTSFIHTEEGYVQVATRNSSTGWSEIELEESDSASSLESRFHRWVEFNRPNILRPLELDLVRCGSRTSLVLRLFHALYDANSLKLTLERVRDHYHQIPIKLGPQFLDVLPYGPLSTHEGSRPQWERLLKPAYVKPIPSLASSPGSEDNIATRKIDFTGLEAARMKYGVSHQTIIQSAWFSVLREKFFEAPIFGLILSGRSIDMEDVELTIGPLFNTLPFTVNSNALTSWKALIQATHEYNTFALANPHVPLRDIQKWCSNGRSLFDTLFTFDREDDSKDSLDLWETTSTTGASDYPLAVEFTLQDDNKLQVVLVTQPHVADKSITEATLDHFERAVASLADGDDSHVRSIFSLDDRDDSSDDTESITMRTSTATSYLETPPNFELSATAKRLRDEIAHQVGVSAEEIQNSTTMFDLGLDSIDAMRLVARLRGMEIDLSVSDLMRGLSFEGILQRSQKAGAEQDTESSYMVSMESSISRIREALSNEGRSVPPDSIILPPTPLQDSLMAEMVTSEYERYFNHDILRVAAGTDLQRLTSAWELVLAHSPILRTSFLELRDPTMKTGFCQVVNNSYHALEPYFEIENYEGILDLLDHARVKALEEKESRIFQVQFVRAGDSDYVVLSIAHALYDGWSLSLLHQDVYAAYHGLYKPRSSYVPYLAHILGSSGASAEKFWSEYLHGCKPCLIEVKTDSDNVDENKNKMTEFASPTPRDLILSFCQQQHITLQVLGQACWAIVIAFLTNSLDVNFGVVLSGRETVEAQELLFPTMNTVLTRSVLHGHVGGFLKYMQENLSKINDFQHFPFREAQKLARTDNRPLFNTLFIHQANHHANGDGSTTNPLMESVESASSVEFPLCAEMEMVGESLVWRLSHDSQYLTSDDLRQIEGHVNHVLEYIIRQEKAELLQFVSNGSMVSVCGMSAFSIENDHRKSGSDTVPSTSTGPISKLDSVNGRAIVTALSEISGVAIESILPRDSIYHLGLDSISVMKVSALLRKQGIALSVRDILRANSIGDIVSEAESRNETSPKNLDEHRDFATSDSMANLDVPSLLATAGLNESQVQAVLPASSIQVHMLGAWYQSQGQLFYPEFRFDFRIKASREICEMAWQSLVDEVPMLRTVFAATGSSELPFIQVIKKFQGVPATDADKNGKAEQSWVFTSTSTPFVAVRLQSKQTGMINMQLKIHHALYDGISLPIVVNRFETMLKGQPGANPMPYESAWENTLMRSYSPEVINTRKAFWSNYLAGVELGRPKEPKEPLSSLPTRVSLFKQAVISNASALKSFCAKEGISVQALFFAAYARFIARQNPSMQKEEVNDVVFGVYLANRTSSEPSLEQAPVPTLCIVPLRVSLRHGTSLVHLARQIQKDLADISAFENVTVGLWDIYEWTGLRIDSFVNFLTLPEPSPGQDPEESAETEPNSWTHQDIAHPNDGWLAQSTVNKVFVDAVDVEVAIRGNAVDMGVFGPDELLSREAAESTIEELVRTLEGSIP